jgi:hypothetical protein
MDNGHDHIALTTRERQLLEDLESATALADPGLDVWLRTAKRARLRWTPSQQLLVGVLGVLASTALILGTFTRSLWLAALAAGLDAAAMAIGLDGWRRRAGRKNG